MPILTNLVKAAAAVALTPVAAVADVLTLPGSAYANRPPFGNVESLLRQARAATREALKPEEK